MIKKFVKPVILLTLCVLCHSSLFASVNLTGRIIEASTGDPCPGATVKVFEYGDTVKPVTMNAAEIDGIFNCQLPGDGRYTLAIDYIGKTPLKTDFRISEGESNHDMGTIALYDDSTTLQEFVVTGKRPLIQSDGATLTYNAEEDATAKSSSILELLRKVPMVTVDANDNIRINGQSDFKIYLNGKPSPLLASNASTVLKAMPASAISKLEVITEPGAKYDAEGSGGILNIVTLGAKEQPDNGYFGSVNASFSRMGSGLTFFGKAKYDKVTASLNLNYYTNMLWKTSSTQTSENTFLDDPTVHKVTEMMEIRPDFNYWGGNLNLSWEPNRSNLFTFDVNLSAVPIKINTDINGKATDINNEKVYSFVNALDMDMGRNSVTANTSYQHSFGNSDHTLTFSYQYDHDLEKRDTDQEYLTKENYYPLYNYLQNYNHLSNNSHTIQADYALPLSPFQKFESGAKLLLRRNYGDSWQKTGNTPLTDVDPQNQVDMTQFNDIYALYASYSHTIKQWSALAGVRYEHTLMGANYKTGDYSDYSTRLNDVVPNAAITYSFNPAHNIRAAYQMRISRPNLEQVNPFHFEGVTITDKFGNPDLQSEKIHNLSLAYTNFSSRVGFTVKANYYLTNNMITEYKYSEGGKIFETYRNMGRHQVGSIDVYGMTTLFNSLQIGLGGRVAYDDYNVAQMQLQRHGWSANINGNINYRLPADITLSAFGGGSTKSINVQGNNSGWHYYGISLKKSFLKNKNLDVTINGMNFLTPHFNWEHEARTDNLISRTIQSTSNWNVGISVGYNFGSLKSDVKKTKAQIDNSDASTVKSSSGVSTPNNGTPQ